MAGGLGTISKSRIDDSPVMIVTTLCAGMPVRTLCVHLDAERQSLHYHAERGNDQYQAVSELPHGCRLMTDLWETSEVTTAANALCHPPMKALTYRVRGRRNLRLLPQPQRYRPRSSQ